MNNTILVPSPAQSISVQQEKVPPPNTITAEDLGQQEILSTRKREAQTYHKAVKHLRSDGDVATVQDVAAAEDGAGSIAASPYLHIFNKIIRRLDAIDNSLYSIDNSLYSIDNRLYSIEARQRNALACLPTDGIHTPLVNGVPPPLQPATIGAVMALSGAQCTVMETFGLSSPDLAEPACAEPVNIDVQLKKVLKALHVYQRYKDVTARALPESVDFFGKTLLGLTSITPFPDTLNSSVRVANLYLDIS
eukprot:gene9992-11050_t